MLPRDEASEMHTPNVIADGDESLAETNQLIDESVISNLQERYDTFGVLDSEILTSSNVILVIRPMARWQASVESSSPLVFYDRPLMLKRRKPLWPTIRFCAAAVALIRSR